VSLKFYAVDSLGAAALYWPLLHFCGCARGYCIKVTDMAEYVYSRGECITVFNVISLLVDK